MASLAPKSDFLNLDGVTHLAAGGQTPALRSHVTALERFANAKGTGIRGHQQNQEVRARTAQHVARLIGCAADDVGFPSSVAHGITLLVDSLDWREGDNVVLESWEFPSLLYPFLALRERGVEVRLLQPRSWVAPLDSMRAAVDDRTRVLALSHVSYLTGERKDLATYAQIARDAGALFVVDASHSLGAVGIEAPLADFLFSCCYKWVLGAQGVAVGYWNRERQPDWRPRSLGWHSAQGRMPLEREGPPAPLDTGIVFEPGNPSFAGLYILDNATAYLLELGQDAIERHVLELSDHLWGRLSDLDVALTTPEASERRAGNVCFSTDRAPQIREALEAEGVFVSGEDGRVRISTHLYNDAEDVERGIQALDRVLRASGR